MTGRAQTQAAPGLSIRYRPAGAPPEAGAGPPLLTVTYGAAPAAWQPGTVSMAFPVLGGPAAVEVWHAGTPLGRKAGDGEVAAWTDTLLAGAVSLPEPPDRPVEAVFLDAYRRMFRIADEGGFPHLVRIWNALSDITGLQDGRERYQRFCVARARAFAERGEADAPPAASAVGTARPGAVVVFLAARRPGTHVENPRQVSAYHYPPVYGPKSPRFSRATRVTGPDREILFISGTASVVGHASMHPEDADGQLAETVRNLDALIGTAGFTPDRMTSLKVYLRAPGDLERVRAGLKAAYGDVPALFLQGEMCRRELALEVEAVLERPA